MAALNDCRRQAETGLRPLREIRAPEILTGGVPYSAEEIEAPVR